MTRKQKQWFWGLISGFVGAFAGSIDGGLALMIMHPVKFNLGTELRGTLETMAVLGLLTGIKVCAAYLKNSPLPPLEGDTVMITKDDTTMKDLMKLFAITSIVLGIVYAARASEPAVKSAIADGWKLQGGRF